MTEAGCIALDLTGLSCPQLVLQLAERLRDAPAGACYRVVASDPLSRVDIPYFLHRRGHALLQQGREGDHLVFLIRAGAMPGEAAD